MKGSENKKGSGNLSGSEVFRGVCILVLWLGLCYIVVASQPLTPMILFTIIASGIIVFVPLWKKYVSNKRKQSDE